MRMKYSSKDFALSKLPKTRWKQFLSIIKLEWKVLLLIGVLLMIFSLIFFGCGVAKWLIVNAYYNGLKEAGELEKFESINRLISLIYNAILIIPFGIISIGLSGTKRVFQRLTYGDGLLFKNDFIEGIKLNWKQYLLLSVFFYVFYLLAQINIIFLSGSNNIFSQIFQGLSIGVLYCLIVPILLFMGSICATYKTKITNAFWNGVKLYFMSLLVTLLFSFFIYGIGFIEMIPNIYIRVIIQIGVTIIVIPFFLLGWQLYSYSRFDKFVNENTYPEMYRKGLFDYKEDLKDDNQHKKNSGK